MKNILPIILLFCSFSPAFATENELEITPGNHRVVVLPFDYEGIGALDDITFVAERQYAVLSERVKAIVGPLQPCFFIGITNCSGITVVFHKHFSSSIGSLIEISQNIFKESNPEVLRVKIFTNKFSSYSEERSVLLDEGEVQRSIQDFHEGRSQEEELKVLESNLFKGLSLTSTSQIESILYQSPYANGELGNYELAELFILVGYSLNLKNICIMREEVFSYSLSKFNTTFKEILSLERRLDATMGLLRNYAKKERETLLNNQPVNIKNYLDTYGIVPFKRVENEVKVPL